MANNAATGTTDVANTRRTNAANVANTNDTNATNVANTARTNATNVANTARTNAAATSNTTNDNALRDWAATQNKNLNYALTINGNAANTASNNQAVAKASRDAEEDKTYAYTMKSLSFLSNAVTGTLNTATGLAESVAGLNAFGAVGAVTGGISSVLSLMNSQAAYDASELLINNKRTNLSSYIGPSGSGVTDGIIQIANNKNNDNNAARDTHIDQMTAGEKTRATANTANTVNASNANATASEATSNTNAAASQTTSDANAARSETASNTNAADKATTSYNNAVRSQTTSDANAARSETASNANAAASAATSNANATRSQATSDANAARSETASNTNAAASAATSNANAARSQATSDANAARTRTVSDANAGYARADAVTAAKENLEQAQREAYAALKRASLELTTAGENAGDAELDVLNRRAFKIAVMTQSRYAMESTAATFKRYGYAYGAPIVPRDWLENGMYCYWRGHDAIIKGEAPDLFKRAFEGILTAGVTVWADPGKVGEYE